MLMRGLARVGIIGLVDEATGFQYDRPRRDLEEYLKKFLSESLRRWVRTFPADYFKHLCRLRGVELRTDMKLPQYFGHLTNNLVYRRMAPGLVRRLKEHRAEHGKPNAKLQQCLSVDFGVPEVLVHLGTVVGLMKLHTDYDAFEKQLDTIAPVYPATPGLFDNQKDWECGSRTEVSQTSFSSPTAPARPSSRFQSVAGRSTSCAGRAASAPPSLPSATAAAFLAGGDGSGAGSAVGCSTASGAGSGSTGFLLERLGIL